MKRIVVYYVTTFAITIGLALAVIYPLANQAAQGLVAPSMVTIAIAGMMFMPTIGAVLTRLITREGFKNANFKPVRFRQTFKYYLLAWFAPVFLALAGAAVYFAVNPADFDITMATMVGTVQSQLEAAGLPSISYADARSALVPQLIIGALASPILNFVTCLGEEWGWRGYVLPKVNEHLAFVPTILLTGVLWGLWHAPATILGHNYGLGYPGFPFTGILAMCCFCVVLGTFLSYLTIKAKSCIPATLAHGSINGMFGIGLLFSVSGGNPFIGPMPTGVLGGSACIIVAVLICLRMRKAPLWPAPVSKLPGETASDADPTLQPS